MDHLIILLPAFIMSLVMVAAHIPLGREVLQRGIIFLDLATAQIAALGMMVAEWWLPEGEIVMKQAITLAFALMGAWWFKRVETDLKSLQEAVIGASFIVTSSFAVLLASQHPHGGEELEMMLAGQILWVTWSQVLMGTVFYTLLMVSWWHGIGQRYFYYVFAITVTYSVQIAGIYFVFASLILPSLASLNTVRPLRSAYAMAFCAIASGMIVSSIMDFPTGAVLVCALAWWCCVWKCWRKISMLWKVGYKTP